MWDFIKKNRTIAIFACAFLISVPVLSKLLIDAYATYSDTIITQEQQHLLAISFTVSNNLTLYISRELEKLEVLTESRGFQEQCLRYYRENDPAGLRQYVLNYMLLQRQNLSRIYLLDGDGEVIFRYDPQPLKDWFGDDFLRNEPLISRRGHGVGEIFRITRHSVAMPMVHNISIDGRHIGSVVGVVDLQNLYDEALAPVAVGKSGYLSVADQNGTVIMHPASRRVGTNYFAYSYLKDEYFSEQQQARARQYATPSGTDMYKTLWWLSPYAPKVIEINGYSRARAGENFWVVSAAMDVEEAMAVRNSNVPKMATFAFALIVTFAAGFITIWGMYRNRQDLEQETRSLKVLNSALEDLNKSREQLMHYQKLQTVGNFANGIAHEFNNLLTPILGLSALLLDDLKGLPQAREDAETIHQSGVKAKELVSQLLSFGRKSLDKEPFSVLLFQTIMQDALRIVLAILPPSIELVMDFEHGTACCFGSKTQLHQVVLNLCSNAYQAMEEGGGKLTLRTRRVSASGAPPSLGAGGSGNYIELSVADTGCGMDGGVMEQIFDPYFTTKESGKGTGLGLAVAQGIAVNHDGLIDASSVIGEGSEFRLYLPEVPLAFSPSDSLSDFSKAGRQSGRSSIMIIDDMEDVAKTLARLLEKVGYKVTAHTDPARALADFRRGYRNYDLIITDYSMPVMNGREVTLRIKELRRDVPVILVTSHTEVDLEDWGGLFAGVVYKPLDFGRLCEAVENALSAAR